MNMLYTAAQTVEQQTSKYKEWFEKLGNVHHACVCTEVHCPVPGCDKGQKTVMLIEHNLHQMKCNVQDCKLCHTLQIFKAGFNKRRCEVMSDLLKKPCSSS